MNTRNRMHTVNERAARSTAGRIGRRSLFPLATLTALLLANLNAGPLTTTPAAAAGTISFAVQQQYATGSNPSSVAVGDFNGDSLPDLAVANSTSNTVSVLLGQRDGTLAPQQIYATGGAPASVAIGDFNGDGSPDLAVANASSSTVSVLLGHGDGTFAQQQQFGAGQGPTSIATGDFNGDGIPDLAVANATSNTLSVLQGNGDGTFASQQIYATGGAPASVAIGDFNGDGIPDLAVANASSSTVSVLLGHGDGTFAVQHQFGAGQGPHSMAVGDFNGDAIPDLALANSTSNSVSVLLGKGDGTFAPQLQFSAGQGPRSVAVGDFNRDGIPDLALANSTGNTVSVLPGNGDGTFAAQQQFPVGTNPFSLAVGDFNRDGSPDLAAANESSSTVSLLPNTFVDTLPPAVTVTVPSPVYGQNDWFAAPDASPVSVSIGATDTRSGNSTIQQIDCTLDGNAVGVHNASGIGSSPTASGTIPVAGDGVHTIACTATDAAGNASQSGAAGSTGTVRIDTTPPSLTPNASSGSQPYSSGAWTNAPVAVSFECTDATSGVASTSQPVTISTEGANQSATGSCTDAAGNTTSATFSGMDIDHTPPQLSGAPTSPPNGNGWYHGDVSIAWTCSDALSGISGSCPAYSTISGEGMGLTASASVTDIAGNSTSATSSPSVNIDRTPPITTANAPGGWNNTDVSVTLSASDSLSGVQETDYTIDGGSRQTYQSGATLTFSTEGVHTLTYWSVDEAGNTEAAHTIQIKIDKTAPTITSVTTPATNANGWNNSNVTVTFTCTDALSGIQSCDGSPTSPGVSTLATEGLGQLLVGTAVDNATNTATGPVILNIDETAPRITGSVFPAPNAKGWNNSAVNVSFTCVDPKNANGTPGSGIATCSAPVVLSSQGSGQSVTGSATDGAGNTTSTTVGTINIDTTPPIITFVSQTPAASANGWNNGPVIVTWSCSDALSGVAKATVSATVSSEGANQSVTGTCTDKAGNIASSTRSGINVDLTPPSLAPTVSPNPVLLNGSAMASPNATDALSGIATQSCGSAVTSSVGSQTVSCSATDKAGNAASGSAAYTVTYGQKLLYNTTTLYKSGSTILVALQLQDAKGSNVSSAGITVTAVSVVNSSGTVVKTINAPFTFSASKGQYTYSLTTTGLTTGNYNLQLAAGSDPIAHLAPFSVK